MTSNNSLINCILDTNESLGQNLLRLAARKDLVQNIDEKLFEIYIANLFTQGELDSTSLTQFLRLLEVVSAESPHLFDKTRLTLINLILQRNEYLLTRKIDKFELFVQILVNLNDNLEFLGQENLKFVLSGILDFSNSRNSNSGSLVELNC